jgi:AcrR family transcriptional regulator
MTPRGQKLNERMRAEATAKITRAALEVFAEYGYYGAKMGQIMRISGLSKGLVYHYFPSKEKVFFHLVQTALEISQNIWREALDPPGSAWEKIERLSERLACEAFTKEASLYNIIMMQAMIQGKGIPGMMAFIFQHTAYYQELPRLIAEAQESGEAAPGDPELLASTYLALFLGFTFTLADNKEMRKKISPEIFLKVLRNTAAAE